MIKSEIPASVGWLFEPWCMSDLAPFLCYTDDHSSAAFAALTTSAINVIVLVGLRGHELGWLCLASCGTDVSVISPLLASQCDSPVQGDG